jgi:hypothetical protein
MTKAEQFELVLTRACRTALDAAFSLAHFALALVSFG